MTFADTLLQNVLTAKRLPTKQFDGPQQGEIVTADAATGTATFTIPAFSRTALFGPAPYPQPSVQATSLSTTDGISPNPHGHPPAVPPRGTKCLVLFAATLTGDWEPWIVAFAGWPA